MKILVTGASGFVGQAAVTAWAALGHEIYAVSRRPLSLPDVEQVVWDLREPADPKNFPSEIEAVVHMAQSRQYRDFPADAAEMFDVNVRGAQNLLGLSAALRPATVCMISSGNVYEPYNRLDEEAPLSPTGYLGASKLAAENLARAYGQLFRINVLRLFQPYGPGQQNRLIPDLIRRVLQGEPISVGSDQNGMSVAPTYVDDVVAVILDAVTEGWQGTYNVAAPEVLSIRDMGETIGRVVGVAPVFEMRPGPSLRLVPSLDRLSNLIALGRFRTFEQGITDMMRADPAWNAPGDAVR